MANQRMTQTQLVKILAEKNGIANKAAKEFLEHLATLAIGEVKKNGLFVLPGIGRLVRVDRKKHETPRTRAGSAGFLFAKSNGAEMKPTQGAGVSRSVRSTSFLRRSPFPSLRRPSKQS